jgi:pseudouridylate synthase
LVVSKQWGRYQNRLLVQVLIQKGTMSRGTGSWLRFSPEVADARSAGSPIVALESTVIAHGLPRPRNLETAREVEALIRARGAVPATIAVLDGVPTIGLSPEQLERLADEAGVEKLSTRDLPVAMARRTTGGTTVASTAHLASRAGIEVFATGGIGGVHRGPPVDVSADLVELHRTSIIVVSAGAKSILDLRATREILETLGVLTLGWRTDELPAFYSPRSGITVDARVDSSTEVVEIWKSHVAGELPGGILLCVPIPEESAFPDELLEGALAEGTIRAAAEGVEGREVTPYLLRAITEASGGATVDANVALLLSNAAVAAEIAVKLKSR